MDQINFPKKASENSQIIKVYGNNNIINNTNNSIYNKKDIVLIIGIVVSISISISILDIAIDCGRDDVKETLVRSLPSSCHLKTMIPDANGEL